MAGNVSRLIVLFCMLALSVSESFAQQAVWSRGPNLPVQQSEWYGATIGDSIYCMGGEIDRVANDNGSSNTGKASNETWIYNVKTEKFTRAADMPEGRNHLALTALDKYIYVVGGYPQACCGSYPWPYGTTNTWRYTPSTNKWDTLAPLPRQMGAGTIEAFDGKLYAFGGTTSGEFHSVPESHVYDPALNIWKNITSMTVPHEHVRGTVVDSLIYVISGHQDNHQTSDGKRINQPKVEVYAPTTNTWSLIQDIPVPRGGIGVAYIGGKIYVMGGEIAADSNPVNTVTPRLDIYDIPKKTWSRGLDLPAGFHGMCLAAHTPTGTIHMIGGSKTQGFAPVNEHHILTVPEVLGCTNPKSSNFNIYATKDNGSCASSLIQTRNSAVPYWIRNKNGFEIFVTDHGVHTLSVELINGKVVRTQKFTQYCAYNFPTKLSEIGVIRVDGKALGKALF